MCAVQKRAQSVRVVVDTRILSPRHIAQLKKWIAGGDADVTWTLLYRATRDGKDVADLHRLCDGKTSIVIVAKAFGEDTPQIAGGFTAAEFGSLNTADQRAFLFR